MSELSYRVHQVEHFLQRLAQDPELPGTDLCTVPSMVPGWWIQKDREATYSVTTPDDRPGGVPWAHVPPPRTGWKRAQVLELLQEVWRQHAAGWVLAQKHGG